MSSELMRLFDAAVELPPEQRGRFLERECAGDAVLRARVEALLAADRTPAAHALDDLLAPTTTRLGPGTLVAGRYRIVAARGEGGMGIVYEAEQLEPRRRVALKCLRPGSHAPAALQRFAREAELMARLQHPGVAQVYEAGVVDEATQQPFLAMEWVGGRPLLEALRDATRNEQLAVFADVCEAVQHAHGLGIVHRDLKPSNVLVERVGTAWHAKVLDFGIARMLADDAGLTRTHEIVGTLAWLAPEQFAPGAAAAPGSDVWALGVTLYMLLAGRAPFALDGLPVAAAAQRLANDEPPRLDLVAPATRGDLATIVHKALAKEPARRYADAGELAADLRRFLRHEPVTARAPGAVYRASRFVRRHRGLVAGTAIAFGALTAALVWSLRAAADEARQRQVAEQLARDLRLMVRDVVFDVDWQLATLPAATAARRVLVDAGNRYAERLLAAGVADAALWHEVGAVLHRLGVIQGVPGGANLGDAAAAETSLRRALDLLQRARAAGSTNPTLRPAIVGATRDLADVLRVAGRRDEAMALLGGLDVVITEHEAAAGVPAAEALRALVLPSTARLRQLAGDLDGARRDFTRARDALQAQVDAGDDAARRGLSVAETTLAELAMVQQDVAAATAAFARALTAAEAAAARAGATPADREQLALALQAQAGFLVRRKQPADALPLLDRALAVFRAPELDDPGNVQRGRSIALVEFSLADAHMKAGDFPAAKPFAMAYLARIEALRAKAPGYRSLDRDLAIARELLGRLAVGERDEAALEANFAAALAAVQDRVRAQPTAIEPRVDLLRTWGQLGFCRNSLANAGLADTDRARLYEAAADALGHKLTLLQQLDGESKLSADLQPELATTPGQIQQLRDAATRLTR